MNLIPGEASTLLSADSVGEEQAAMYPTEFLDSITPNGLPPHRLYLKVYAPIILLRSFDPTQGQGMCNGTRLTIKAFLNRIIDAEIATGVHKGKRVFIPRIPMTPSDSDFPFVLRRRQWRREGGSWGSFISNKKTEDYSCFKSTSKKHT